MKFAKFAAVALAATVLPFASAHFTSAMAQTVKIGFITSYTGQNASVGAMMDQAVKLWMKQNEKSLPAGVKVEIINRDDTGPNPEVAKRLATELVTRDRVNFLAGVIWTPIAAEAKVPFVIMNAGTSGIIPSGGAPFVTRVSFTLWQSSLPLGQWAAKNNLKRVYSLVSDFGPGIDAETAFKSEFAKQGGTVVESIRMPIATTDFGPFAQRIKASGAQAVYTFLPGGPPNLGFVKAYNENGLAKSGIQFLGTAETDEFDLPKLGDAAIGLTTAFHYSGAHDSPANRKFVEELKKRDPNVVANYASVGAWDGMVVIHKMIEATGGQRDGLKALQAARSLQWESPRGPVRIDGKTRHIVQNVYLRKVEKQGNALVNKEVQSFGPQVDHGLDNK